MAMCQVAVPSPLAQNKINDKQWNDLLDLPGTVSSLSGSGISLLDACLSLSEEQTSEVEKFRDALWKARQDGKLLGRIETEQSGEVLDLDKLKNMEPGPIKSAYDKWDQDYGSARNQMLRMRKVLGNKSNDFLQWVFEQEGILNKIQFPKRGQKLDEEEMAEEIVAGSKKEFGEEKKSGYNWSVHKKRVQLRIEYFLSDSRPASMGLLNFEKKKKVEKMKYLWN